MPRYLFHCGPCGLEFEVSRAMSEAGRAARCPVDGTEANRVFTAPMTAVHQNERAAPAGTPSGEGAPHSWSSPFFPKSAPRSEAARPVETPRHTLPPGSSKPTRFRHFGHWHPAGTPPHTHRARGPASPAPEGRSDA